MLNSYLDLIFDVLLAVTGNRYTDGNDVRLVNLGPIALSSSYMSTASSGKHLEDFSHAHIVSLMYKLITSARDTDGLNIGFDRDSYRRKPELINIETIKGKYHVRNMLKDVFGFAEHEKRATYGLGYKLNLTRNSYNSVVKKANATNNARIKINRFEWYLPHYTPSMEQQKTISKQTSGKITTQLQYVERFAFMKEVNTRNFWTSELGTQEGTNFPIWILVGSQQKDRQESQNSNNETFF